MVDIYLFVQSILILIPSLNLYFKMLIIFLIKIYPCNNVMTVHVYRTYNNKYLTIRICLKTFSSSRISKISDCYIGM